MTDCAASQTSSPAPAALPPLPLPKEPLWPHRHLLLALLVLAAGLTVTYQLWRTSERRERDEMRLNFEFHVREATTRVEQRMAAYEQILRSAAGFMSHADSLNRNAFRDFVETLRLDERYPGIQGLAFTRIVPATQKNRHIAAVRGEGFPDYTITPAGERDMYAPVIYIEPFSAMNQRAFGHDPYSHPMRRLAMDKGRDLDLAVITDKVILVQDDARDGQAGFMMYQPVYQFGMPHRGTAERRAAIIGWIAAPFRMSDLMNGMLGEQAEQLDIAIFDGEEISDGALMYASHHGGSGSRPDAGLFMAARRITVANHAWTMQIRSRPGLDAGMNSNSSILLACSGIGISLMLALLTLMLASGRERALQAARRMNRELIDSETRYRNMFEKNISIAYLLDPESGRIVDANPAAAAFWGYSREHLRSMNISEINTASCERLRQVMREKSTGKIFRVEWRHRLNNGEVRDVEVFSGPLVYQGRTLLFSILHDISARKKAERALEESEFRWKFALEGSGEGVWDWNIATNEVQYSSRWKSMLGYAEDDIESTFDAWEKIVHPADRPRAIAGVQAHLDGKIPVYTCEYRMRCKDGSWKWVLARGMVISRNDAGQPMRAIGTQADIADRKQAEQVQVHRIIESAPDPMMLVDCDGRIVFANSAAHTTFGYAPDHLIGLGVENLVPERSRGRHAQLRAAFEQNKHAHPFNRKGPLNAAHKDGTEFPVEMGVSQFEMDGQSVVIASIRDISERQRAAELLQQSFTELRRLSDHQQRIKEEERKRIAQDIHDELGQNLLVLKMDVAALCARTGTSHPKLHKWASVVLHNIDVTLQSVKTIMNDLRPATLELGLYPAVEWQVKQFERTTGIACSLATAARDTAFSLDESQTTAVFRILQESLTNVARHANATEVWIELCEDEQGFSMTVRDNGKGLQPGDRRKGKSYGLRGIRERAESLGGRLVIAGSPGKGTALSISIPLKEARTEA